MGGIHCTVIHLVGTDQGLLVHLEGGLKCKSVVIASIFPVIQGSRKLGEGREC